MTQYTLIGAASTRAARVLWMLEELGVPYEHIGAKPHSDSVTTHYPHGKVPVLLVDGAPLTDSTAILQYLADVHGRFTAPCGTMARARQDGMVHFLIDEFDAVLWTSARHSFILPEEHRVPAVKDSLRWEFSRNQTAAVRRMGEHPYATGEEFTVADILLTHCLMWARAAKFAITEPALGDYAARISARPAFQRVFAGR